MYATVANTKEKYSRELLIRLTNFEGVDDFTAIKDTGLGHALEDASDLMDGYLSERYPTPITPAPDFFVSDCQTLAIMLLIQRKGYVAASPDEALYNAGQDVLKNRYEKFASGKMSLADLSSGSASIPKTNIQSSAPEMIFSKETLDKF